MSTNGGADLTILARTALLDALEALREHRASIVVVGAQAVYLHTGSARVALAEATSDSDIAIDPRTLGDHPLIDEAMLAAGFTLPTDRNRLGTYFSSTGIQVGLMVPEALNESPGRRGARVPPHPKESMM